MSTVAGSSSVGDGLLGTEAFLVAPTFAKVVNGELFICDSGTIRKLLTNGTIISLVSDLKVSGDANAPLASGLDVAANGDIYVVDYANHKIKKVSSGLVSVIAGTGNTGIGTDGNLAINSDLSGPHSIAFHPITGEIYFSQPTVNKIRKIGTDNIVSTVAGTSSPTFGGDGDLAINAKLFGPSYIAFDASGNLFISDVYNLRIRKVTYSDGKISTFAGSGEEGNGGTNADPTSVGFSYPSGIAVNPSNGDVYICDRDARRIHKVSNGKINGFAGTSYMENPFSIGDGGLAVDAYLKDPAGLFVNSNGELLIVDSGFFRIRKVSTSGYISTIVGGGIGDGKSATEGILKTPKDVILAENGVDLLIADYNNGRVRKVSNNIISTIAGDQPTTSADGSLATKTRIIGLESIALAPNGDLYLVEQSRIRKISKSDGKIYTVAGTSIVGNSPDGSVASTSQIGILKSIAFNSLGEVVFTDYWNNQIKKVSSGGLLVTLPNQSNTRFGSLGLRGLVINSKDEIIFADVNNYVITKIAQNGQFITLAGTGSPGSESADGNLATIPMDGIAHGY